MSNQEPQKIDHASPTSGVCASHMRQTYVVTSSTEVGRASPMGQAAGPRNESVLQSFNLAKY